MDPLIELPTDKWPALCEELKNLWPINVPGYYALVLNMRKPQVREAFQFRVYCPFGDIKNGFVSLNTKAQGSIDVIVFPTTESTRKLEEALLNTKLIDWTCKICIDLVTPPISVTFNTLYRDLGLVEYDVRIVDTFYYDKTWGLIDLRSPPNTNVSSIELKELEHVDEVWPYKFEGSLNYFTVLTSNDLSYGLYLKDKLVAWVFFNEYFFICHLFCEDACRGKGYAEFLIKYIVNIQVKNGNDSYAYVEKKNVAAYRLFEKCGFKNIDNGAYVFAHK